jgi:predicted esterase
MCAHGRDYWILAPEKLAPHRAYWLVVLVHGFGGRGEEALWMRRALARFDDFIIVAPSFPEGFQLLEHETDRQLIDLFRSLRQRRRLHERMFLVGFSAGAQFAHRFTMRHPALVAGCAAHSGGTWGPDCNPAARHIPIAVSCGLDDIARSSIAQQRSRVQAAHKYFRELAAAGFHIKARLFSGLAHHTSPATEALIAECYQLATRGLFAGTAPLVAAGSPASAVPTLAGVAALERRRDDAARPPPRAEMNRTQRQAFRVAHVARGLGGRSLDGANYWVDDSRENADGWCDHELARRHRAAVLERHLGELREAVGRGR